MDTVVLLHGLWRSRWSMAWPAWRLRAAGFRTVGITYPSRRMPIDALAHYVARRLPDPGAGRLHFMTHSLGGLVVRELVRTARPPGLGRVVMIGPPNQGSDLARQLQGSRVLRALAGPVGPLLASEADAVTARLGPVDFEVGVIAGAVARSVLARRFDGPGDGRVLVSETRVEGMADLVVVGRGHAFIMNSGPVIDQTIHFLQHGRFQPSSAASLVDLSATASRERT
ncbi:MAG TPA: alpha/beta hydrolase [Vicinamibacterales bacterium]|nr:alpha/beta hydrolase [Vicinamibacterales bacterium]